MAEQRRRQNRRPAIVDQETTCGLEHRLVRPGTLPVRRDVRMIVAGLARHEGAVEQVPIPQERLRGIERSSGIATVGKHTCAVDAGQAQDVGHHQFGETGQVRVLHEEPTDQVMLVAKPGRHAVIGQQHHPGILQTTGRQHVHPRADPVSESTQRL